MLRSSLALPPVALAARAGDPLPGALDGARLRDFRFHGLPDGTVLIQSMLDDVESPGDGSTPHALLRWRPASGLETFERAGEPSAFAGGGETLAEIGELASNPAGQVLLFMRSGDGEPALWLGDAEGIVPLLPLAGPVPGGPGDAAFASPDLVQRERSS